MSNLETAFIECASSNNQVFNNSLAGDIMFYPSYSRQSILLGTKRYDDSSFIITSNNIGIGETKPKEKLHIKGNTIMDGHLSFFDNGSISVHNQYHGLYFNTLADDDKLVSSGYVNSADSLNIVNQIPVYNLQKSPKSPTIGCLSKDLITLFPNCVNTVNNVEMIDYTKLIPLLISSIQELKEQINSLQSI